MKTLQNKKDIIHELGNALAIVSGHVDILAGGPTLPGQKDIIEKIYFALALVEQIIKNDSYAGPVAINALLEDAVSACAVFTAAKEIRLSAVSELGDSEFLIEKHKVSQILINLIKNAARHTEQGEITVSVKLNDFNQMPQLEFRVSDTGCGIPPEYLSCIFDPFAGAHISKTGSGLGLLICKALVESMGGLIRA